MARWLTRRSTTTNASPGLRPTLRRYPLATALGGTATLVLLTERTMTLAPAAATQSGQQHRVRAMAVETLRDEAVSSDCSGMPTARSGRALPWRQKGDHAPRRPQNYPSLVTKCRCANRQKKRKRGLIVACSVRVPLDLCFVSHASVERVRSVPISIVRLINRRSHGLSASLFVLRRVQVTGEFTGTTITAAGDELLPANGSYGIVQDRKTWPEGLVAVLFDGGRGQTSKVSQYS
jgi:hypothetical protein